MAITVCEILQSQALSATGTLGGTRKFLVYSSVDGEVVGDTPISPSQAVGATKVVFGQKYSIKEPWVSLLVESDGVTAVEQSLLATNYSVQAHDDRRYTWDVTWEYESGFTGSPNASPIASVSFSVQFIDAWRTWKAEGTGTPPNELIVPTKGDATFTASTGKYTSADDCQGQPIDSAGEPVSVLNRIGELRVEQFYSTWDNDSLIAINSTVGTRNQFDFYGHPEGSVLYLGATANVRVVSATASFLQATVQHVFAFDQFYHCRQMCGKMSTDGSGGWSTGNSYFGAGSSPPHVATHGFPVVFIQPFPVKTDFDLVLGTAGSPPQPP